MFNIDEIKEFVAKVNQAIIDNKFKEAAGICHEIKKFLAGIQIQIMVAKNQLSKAEAEKFKSTVTEFLCSRPIIFILNKILKDPQGLSETETQYFITLTADKSIFDQAFKSLEKLLSFDPVDFKTLEQFENFLENFTALIEILSYFSEKNMPPVFAVIESLTKKSLLAQFASGILAGRIVHTTMDNFEWYKLQVAASFVRSYPKFILNELIRRVKELESEIIGLEVYKKKMVDSFKKCEKSKNVFLREFSLEAPKTLSEEEPNQSLFEDSDSEDSELELKASPPVKHDEKQHNAANLMASFSKIFRREKVPPKQKMQESKDVELTDFQNVNKNHADLEQALGKFFEKDMQHPFWKAIDARQYNRALRIICTSKEKIAFDIAQVLLSFKEKLKLNIDEQVDGRAAIDYAAQKNKEIYDLLVRHGAKVAKVAVPSLVL